LIVVSVSEGAQFDSNLYPPGDLDRCQLIADLISTKWASCLIVNSSKTSLHFGKDCGIFCEEEWEHQCQWRLNRHNKLIKLNSAIVRINSLIGLVGLSLLYCIGLVGRIIRDLV
jgi:hypothetical protein